MFKSLKKAMAVALIALCPLVAKAEYPERTINLVYPWGPGLTMSISQILAEAMSDELGVAMPVISTPGAAGTKGFLTAMNRPADGYTLIDGYVAPLVLQPLLGNADWTFKDFTPLHSAFSNPFAIAIRKDNDRWASFEELMAYAKEHPGDLRYSSGSRNNLPHMVIAKTLQGFGAVAQNIPYNADADAMSDLRSGVLDFAFINVAEYQTKPDAYKVLIVLSDLEGAKESFNGAPSIADLAIDLGLSGLAPMGWNWWLVHSDTPPERVAVLRKAMATAMARDDVQQAIKRLGFVPLKWDWDQYDEVVAQVQGQLTEMGNALKWEEEQLSKLK
ncbi:Bug family tripartite tricarboxylate transporter substrate binding protein [Marinobacterium rhizophilum]|uniref:Tripartite tricarboxylate transporter substrate binding protein n=1 Tax=Marinobacterium rhizophilum TaxID=420402 RepID=A0ABY5HG40_9GAMM|nr:tripartite tricarboxylate transporter substrate binding protein [Marinobacterium rhizophilum]UTW11213.1 tripartite tricarboxylate transporter substrate binding protein [Marinobacterium rhizophilum]